MRNNNLFVMPTPDPAAECDRLRKAYTAKFRPADEVEKDWVEELTQIRWQQIQLSRIEESLRSEALDGVLRLEHLSSIQYLREAYDLRYRRCLKILDSLRKSQPEPEPPPVVMAMQKRKGKRVLREFPVDRAA